ncbi:MAG: hypothetical protein ACYTAN_01775 [Planctomycetota bacterium]
MPASDSNYEIVGLSPEGTVVVRVDGQAAHDSGERPSEVGLWGLSRQESRILRSGMARTGRDRKPRGG